jgi:hypothetical protein
MAHAARFQTFEVLNRRVKQLPVAVGHEDILTAARRCGNLGLDHHPAATLPWN